MYMVVVFDNVIYIYKKNQEFIFFFILVYLCFFILCKIVLLYLVIMDKVVSVY